jgi:hypothetical protein
MDDPLLEVVSFVRDDAGKFLSDRARGKVECPATFVPVEMRQTGMRGTGYVTREEATGRRYRRLARKLRLSSKPITVGARSTVG